MSSAPNQWTRRAFSQACAAVAASSCLGPRAFGSTFAKSSQIAPDGFAYVACSPTDTHGSIQVFRSGPQPWTHVETISALAPSHLERHPNLPVLYVLHATEVWQNLPRGAVSAWAIDTSSGKLQFLRTQPLALSATSPTHACITPDGKQMIVAATGGGALNVLPLDEAGRPGPPHILRKEVGRFDDAVMTPSRPHQLVMHPAGKIFLSADTGNETLRSFRLGQESLKPLEHLRPHSGSAVSQVALSSCGEWAFAAHAENGSVAVFRLDAAGSLAFQSRALPRDPGPIVLAIHPAGDFLLTASSDTSGDLAVRRFDRSQGTLRILSSLPHREAIRQIAFSPDGQRLVAMESRTGRLISFSFDPKTGRLGTSSGATQLDAPVSLLQTNAIQPDLARRKSA
jgi:6-phosphogluconolactonase